MYLMDIHEFSKTIGETPRQIRFLVSEGFIPPPTGGRARARYGEEHLNAVRRYRWLREQYSPQQIKVMAVSSSSLRLPLALGVDLYIDPERVGTDPDIEAIAARVRQLLLGLPLSGDLQSSLRSEGHKIKVETDAA
jgi:MerR family copper efflux transcriptional regulator